MKGDRSKAAASAARRPSIAPVPEGLDRPRWSVMIPTCESGAHLARTLESVLAQDPGPDQMQIRVIDDASVVDDPRFIVDRVAGDRVSVWRQPRRVGAPSNFTMCVQQAVGHLVHILHSDDLVLPSFYERYGERIEEVEQVAGACAMAAGRCYLVDEDEVIQGERGSAATDRGMLVDPERTLARHHPFGFVSVVVPRASYETLGGFDPALVHANDWEMWTRLAALGPVAVVDEPLSMYRRHPDSDTNRLQRSTAYLRDTLEAVDIIAERFEDPSEGRDFRRASRRQWSGRALKVATRARARGDWANAGANAARAVQLHPRATTVREAISVLSRRPPAPDRA